MFNFLKSKFAPRNRIYVNKQVQGRLSVRMGIYWGIYHIALWQSLFIYRYFQYRLSAFEGGELLTFRELHSRFVAEYSPMLVCALILLPIFVWDLIKMTHRVVGPLVRFDSTLRALQAGKDVKSVQLRKGDMLIEFQATFNEFLKHYSELKQQAEQNRSATDSLESAVTLTDSQKKLLEEIMADVAGPELFDTAEFRLTREIRSPHVLEFDMLTSGALK